MWGAGTVEEITQKDSGKSMLIVQHRSDLGTDSPWNDLRPINPFTEGKMERP